MARATSSGPEPVARALVIGSDSPLTSGVLAGWLASGNEVAAYWSDAGSPRRSGIGTLRLGPGGLLARHRIACTQVPWLSRWPAVIEAARATGADVLISAATQMIVPRSLLSHFGSRAVNFHPTMLPEYRGPSPYLPMLLDGRGDSDGGVTLHVLSAGIDEGDVIAQTRVPFSLNGGQFTPWYAALIRAAHDLARDALPQYLQGQIDAVPQSGGSYHGGRPPLLIPARESAARVDQILGRAGSTMQRAVAIPGRERPIRVVALTRSRQVTGTPPRLGMLTEDLDYADARLTLRRATRLERRIEQWRLARLLRPLQL